MKNAEGPPGVLRTQDVLPGLSGSISRFARLAGCIGLLVGSFAFAQNYALPWNSINNGGSPGVGSNYRLNGSISQAVIGTGTSASTHGWWGFWYGWPAAPANQPDVGVVTITAPSGPYDTAATITPAATVKNFGADPASFDVYFLINDGGTYSDRVTIPNLAGGATAPATFAAWPKPHATGSYVTRCSTYIAGDANHSNDARGGSFSIVYAVAETGWVQKADVPNGIKSKRVKDGGCLAYSTDPSDSSYIYALKGNNRFEFYRYNTGTNTWVTKESIPAIGRSGKKKAVKKGAAMTAADGSIYAAKGNSTYEFWRYDPSPGRWQQTADVPAGARSVKEGTGAATITVADTTYVYFLKGSSTLEFYRYSVAGNAWESRANAPAGTSGKAYKNGSCIAYDDANTIYALKASYNELGAYNVATNTWSTRAGMPMIGASGKKKKVKDGAGIAYHNGYVYALKGNNTQEFWAYQADSDRWVQKPDIPLGGGKKVKGGGSLVYAARAGGLYALKGNNTFEFWKYGLAAYDAPLAIGAPDNAQSTLLRIAGSGLRIAPNPASPTTTISYSLLKPSDVSLRLYDVTGKVVSTLVSGYRDAGVHSLSLQTGLGILARGIYIVRFESESSTATEKLIVE
jgi:hypothetical protein